MSASPRTRRPRIVALLGFLVLLLSAVLGTASSASAHHTAETSGNPGAYDVTQYKVNGVVQPPFMIQALTMRSTDSTGTKVWPGFYTNGVTVARSAASPNKQRISAAYVFQRYDVAQGAWVSAASKVYSVDVAGFVPEQPAEYRTLSNHLFQRMWGVTSGSLVRVTYQIKWVDLVTNKTLGTRTIVPDDLNNTCSFTSGWGFSCSKEQAALRVSWPSWAGA